MEVTRITFQADEQNLVKTGGLDVFASDTVSYIEAIFSLGTNWTGFDSVRAMWKFGSDVYSTVLDHEGKCIVPWEVLTKRGELKVNLVGSIVENDVLTDRLTTFPVIALIISKIAQVEGENTAEITPSEFEQFVAVVKDDADRAEEARDEALTAKDEAGDYALYAKDYSESAESYRDEAKGYAEDAEEASQSILGLEATASVDANVGTPSVNVSVSEVGGNKVMDFDFHNLKGEQGETGADGFSPLVSVEETEDGHEVTITDAEGEHSFEVLNGNVENFYSFLPTDSASGSIASFPDGANNVPMLSLIASIDPVQDLHGQSNPYPPGGGVNKLQTTATSQTINGTTFTVNEDGSVTISGTPTATARIAFTTQIFGEGTWAFYGEGFVTGVRLYGAMTISGTTTYPAFIGADYNLTRTLAEGDTISSILLEVRTGFSGSPITVKCEVAKDTTPTSWSPYSNICPISGRTEVRTVRSGVNLFDKANVIEGYYINDANGEAYSSSGGVSTDFISVLPSTSYYIINPATSGRWGAWYDENKNYISACLGGNVVVTSPSNARYMRMTIKNNSSSLGSVDTFAFNYPSTDHNYHAYLPPLTITTELGQTVYGGTLDVVSGVLTVDYAMIDLGTQAWGYNASGSTVSPYFYTNASPLGVKRLGPFGTTVHHLVCSQYGTVARNTTVFVNGTICADGNANEVTQIQIKDDRFTDATAFKNAMDGVQLCYELATPITVQLTPQEVRTLLGTNNIWSDSGDTSVTYKADIQKYIDKQISAVLNA